MGKALIRIPNEKELAKLFYYCSEDWLFFAERVCGIRLDSEQEEILSAIQHNRRVSVRSGVARGKDFVSAVAAICFLYTSPGAYERSILATKVVLTAPTNRQVKNIMIPEVSKIYNKLKTRMPFYDWGILMADGIRYMDYRDWFLTGFKAGDENIEAWSGLHAPNIMVVVTEASGIAQTTFDSIEGILQGNSKLVLVFNPNTAAGEAYESTRSPLYKKFKLNCLHSPNVTNKVLLNAGKIDEQEYKSRLIPGQVDYDWIVEKLRKPGWVSTITKEESSDEHNDFEFEGNWYRPGKLFRVKVLAEFPEESEDVLIPLHWIERSNQMWQEAQQNKNFTYSTERRIGVDIAGMGRDQTVFTERHGNYVKAIYPFDLSKIGTTIHMAIAGKVVSMLTAGSTAFIDTIGEGAGVYSRLEEQVSSAYSVKFSESANSLTDVTGEIRFVNMRAYLLWAVRDALNPAFGFNLLLPPSDELTEELTGILYRITSNGSIQIEAKEEIKKRIGRSPDYSDSLANTFYPDHHKGSKNQKVYRNKEEIGIF